MGENIFDDESLEFNWANNLKYAAYETLDSNCENPSRACCNCKTRSKCQVYWIHDAVCGKLGCHWLDLGDKLSEWTRLRRWAEKYYQAHREELRAKF